MSLKKTIYKTDESLNTDVTSKKSDDSRSSHTHRDSLKFKELKTAEYIRRSS